MGMFLAALCLWQPACVSLPASPSSIACGECEEQEQFVRLQNVSSGVLPPAGHVMAHPFFASREEWALILSTIHVQRLEQGFPFAATKRAPEPAFTSEDIQYLASTLSKAFARAQPTELITFGLSHPHSPGVTEVTTGGWYRTGRELHLLVANYRYALTMGTVRDRINQNPLYPLNTDTYEIIQGPGLRVTQSESTPFSPFHPGIVEVTIDYQSLLLTQGKKATESEKGRPAGQIRSIPPPMDSGARSVEERLEVLERLKERGLVSQTEYDEKKRELLDNL